MHHARGRCIPPALLSTRRRHTLQTIRNSQPASPPATHYQPFHHSIIPSIRPSAHPLTITTVTSTPPSIPTTQPKTARPVHPIPISSIIHHPSAIAAASLFIALVRTYVPQPKAKAKQQSIETEGWIELGSGWAKCNQLHSFILSFIHSFFHSFFLSFILS
ncbi:hypothetical protein BKA81DRAFT_111792 [Phyllosticta paracitricarpa]